MLIGIPKEIKNNAIIIPFNFKLLIFVIHLK